VHLDGPLPLSELGPGKKGEAKVDSGGVQGVKGILKAESVFGGDALASMKEGVEKLLIDAVVTGIIGVREGGALDVF